MIRNDIKVASRALRKAIFRCPAEQNRLRNAGVGYETTMNGLYERERKDHQFFVTVPTVGGVCMNLCAMMCSTTVGSEQGKNAEL